MNNLILNIFTEFDSNSVQNVVNQLKEKSSQDFQFCIQQLYKILPLQNIRITERIFCKIVYKFVHNEPIDIMEIYKQDYEEFQRENKEFFTMLKTI